jgi:hypothetical protein
MSPDHKDFIAFVYAIRAGDFVKIGVARDVKRRLLEMQTACPYELHIIHAWPRSDPFGFEQWLHKQLEAKRYRGEWFKITDAELDDYDKMQ